jgi:hypothetical protein
MAGLTIFWGFVDFPSLDPAPSLKWMVMDNGMQDYSDRWLISGQGNLLTYFDASESMKDLETDESSTTSL